MTVTLQDMSMILALPIEGKPLCIDTSCEDWRGKMFDLIGKVPDDIINKEGWEIKGLRRGYFHLDLTELQDMPGGSQPWCD
jgi:hypothetical protein